MGGVVGLALIAGAVFFFLRRRRNHYSGPPSGLVDLNASGRPTEAQYSQYATYPQYAQYGEKVSESAVPLQAEPSPKLYVRVSVV